MKILVVGASKGLGKAFVEGLVSDGDTIIGISRNQPNLDELQLQNGVMVNWIETDMSSPIAAADAIDRGIPDDLDVIIYNLGIWEDDAFTDNYRFLDREDKEVIALVNTNITSAIVLIKRVMPKLLKSERPQIVLIGSTSGLSQSGGREVAFGASKFALRGIADALRESFREQRLAVTCLHLGDLNTKDDIATPIAQACQRGNGRLIPMHDVVVMTKALLRISPSSYVKEMTLPPILDSRF